MLCKAEVASLQGSRAEPYLSVRLPVSNAAVRDGSEWMRSGKTGCQTASGLEAHDGRKPWPALEDVLPWPSGQSARWRALKVLLRRAIAPSSVRRCSLGPSHPTQTPRPGQHVKSKRAPEIACALHARPISRIASPCNVAALHCALLSHRRPGLPERPGPGARTRYRRKISTAALRLTANPCVRAVRARAFPGILVPAQDTLDHQPDSALHSSLGLSTLRWRQIPRIPSKLSQPNAIARSLSLIRPSSGARHGASRYHSLTHSRPLLLSTRTPP